MNGSPAVALPGWTCILRCMTSELSTVKSLESVLNLESMWVKIKRNILPGSMIRVPGNVTNPSFTDAIVCPEMPSGLPDSCTLTLPAEIWIRAPTASNTCTTKVPMSVSCRTRRGNTLLPSIPASVPSCCARSKLDILITSKLVEIL